MFDFPNTPAVGQTTTAPTGARYQWDGVKWVTVGDSAGNFPPGGISGNVQYNNAGVLGGLTNTQLTTRIQPFSATLSGAVLASGGGTANFLRADGAFVAPPSAALPSVQNVAAFNAAMTLPATGSVMVNGYYAAGDGGGGEYVRGAAASPNGGTILHDGTGASWYLQRYGRQPSVMQFGAYGDGTHDDTMAIRAAIATGLSVYIPAGTFLVSDVINLTTLGQVVRGSGVGKTVIKVPATFNLSAGGVFMMLANLGNTLTTLSQAGPGIEDLDIVFAQPDTATKASLIHYPAAIYVTNTLRWSVKRVRIIAGWDGIRARFTSAPGEWEETVGGGYMYDLQLGCLNINIFINGATDSMRIENCHFFPYGLTTNQSSIFTTCYASDTVGTVGIYSVRCDDIHVHGCLFYVGLGVFLDKSANGITFGEFTGCDFDSFSGMIMYAGEIQMSAVNFSSTANGNRPIQMFGGMLAISGATFGATNQTAGIALIYITCLSGNVCGFTMSSFVIDSYGLDVYHVAVNTNASPGVSQVCLSNGLFRRDANTTYANPTILISSAFAVLSLSNCQANVKGTGTGRFVTITTDNWHRVIGNSPNGFTYSFPAAVNAVYANN